MKTTMDKMEESSDYVSLDDTMRERYEQTIRTYVDVTLTL